MINCIIISNEVKRIFCFPVVSITKNRYKMNFTAPIVIYLTDMFAYI